MAENENEDIVIGLGSNVKALGDGRIGGHLVLWGNPEQHDFYGDYFTPDTYLGPDDGLGRDVTINHRAVIRTGDPASDNALKALITPIFKPAGLKAVRRDDLGVFAEVMCDLSDEYDAMVYKLAEQGKLKFSAGAPSHMIEREKDGRLKMFVIAEAALTPIPAEPRMVTSRVMPLKAYLDFNSTPNSNPAPERQEGAQMNILEAIKKLVPGITPEQADAVATILGLTGYQVGAPAEAEGAMPDMNEEPGTEAPPTRSIALADLVGQLKSLNYSVQLPGQPAPEPARKPAAVRPPLPFAQPTETPESAATKSLEAVYVMKYGEDEAARKAIMTDAIGTDYRQRILEQDRAFAKFLRGGAEVLDAGERKSLRVQIFPLKAIEGLVREGMDVSSVKSTMIEAQGDLGGFAVPPNFQAEILARQPGLTAVRSAGANVITLAQGNAIDVPVYDGGTDNYVGNIRGQWGTETQAPTVQNAKLKQVSIPAQIYTYKVPMSMSIVEDAANLVSMVQQDMADTLAIDEDYVFLVGDGVGKPLGLLPGGTNGLSLTEVKSASASTIVAAGVKALKRGIASQYRQRGTWVGNSDTFGVIEALTVGGGNLQYAFPDLSDTQELLGRKVYESEAMPDVAANAYPLLFGDFRGYTIVERLGMTIERFHDSATGVNTVEYHLRRRIGGRVTRPWLFAAMKITA